MPFQPGTRDVTGHRPLTPLATDHLATGTGHWPLATGHYFVTPFFVASIHRYTHTAVNSPIDTPCDTGS